jgi:hypothetical protein
MADLTAVPEGLKEHIIATTKRTYDLFAEDHSAEYVDLCVCLCDRPFQSNLTFLVTINQAEYLHRRVPHKNVCESGG